MSTPLHLPCDQVEDFDNLCKRAEDGGIRLGIINASISIEDLDRELLELGGGHA